MRLVQPPNTTKYEVGPSDTIARIALRYNTTPTELSRLNHLATSLLYPGQTLFVPDKTGEENEKERKAEQKISLLAHAPGGGGDSLPIIEVPKKNETSAEKDMSFSPDKGLDDLLSNERLQSGEDEISRKYLKLKSKYVTDGQGVVSGVLLVTPQTVMFNPCVSDHLVMERGREIYVVRLPLRAISKIILFEDIAAMVIGDMSKQYIPKISFIDYASEFNTAPKPGMIVCQETGETYALHTNFEKSSLPKDELLHERYSHDELHDDAFLHDTKDGGDSSEDQGISSSEQLSSDSTVKDITMMTPTPEITPTTSALAPTTPLNNNECASCQNFSEFMEDSQFSSTPKHKKLHEISETPSDENIDSPNTDSITLCNDTDVSNDMCVTDRLTNLEEPLATFNGSSSSSNNELDIVDDTTNVVSNIQETNMDDIEDSITSASSGKTIIETTLLNESTNQVVENTTDADMSTDADISIDILGDDLAATMVENHFNISDDTDVISDVTTKKSDVTGGGVKAGYYECDVSKDSGISEVGSTGVSTQDSIESKDFMQQPVSRGTSLSDEARQWLGKRGVHLSLDKQGDAHYNADSESDFETQELVTPRPASKVDDPLMYVAIKVHKSYWCPIRAKQNQIMGVPPNRDQKRREHWFAIPRERVDQFYNFLLYWSPEVCGEDSSGFSTPCSSEHETIEEKSSRTDVAGLKMRRSWSLYSVSSKSSTRSLGEDEIPDLQAESHILTRKQVHLLTRKLPSRTVGHSWELIYSTTIHGISLSTLFRNFQGYDTPVLIVVKDENQKVFGAFMSEVPKVSEGFYGTGESMLYSFLTDTTLKIYNWTGDNNFFIKGSKTSLVIGGGEGVFGLWLDEDLYRGRSHSCKTFANETLSSSEDFICCGLEAWGFV